MRDIETRPAVRTAPPSSFWIVGILAVLWNAFGAYDYTMSQLRDPAYLAQFKPSVVAMLDSLPAWAVAAWATGVWGSLAGALLFLAKSRHAATAYLLSLAGAIISFAYQFTHRSPEMSGAGAVLPLVILGAIVLFWWFARRMNLRGVLG